MNKKLCDLLAVELERRTCDCKSVFKGTGKALDHQMACAFKHLMDALEIKSREGLVGLGNSGIGMPCQKSSA